MEHMSDYIKQNKKIILCGHSAGMINAIAIGQVLAMNCEILKQYLQVGYNSKEYGSAVINSKTNPVNFNYYSKEKLSDDELLDVYNYYKNNPITSNSVNEIMTYYQRNTLNSIELDDIKKKIDEFIRFKKDNDNIIKNNIIIIGSGGHPFFDDSLCSVQTFYNYFTYKPIHFGFQLGVVKNIDNIINTEMDLYLIYESSYYDNYNSPIIGLYDTQNNVDIKNLDKVQIVPDMKNKQPFRKNVIEPHKTSAILINISPKLHSFSVYQAYFDLLFKNSDKIKQFYEAYEKLTNVSVLY